MAGTTRAVFLSYRREETSWTAGRLADRLTDRLGSTQVFMDVDTMEPGADFVAAIAREVASCDVLIALIGPTWSTIADRRGRRRLDDPDDVVVLEIRAALERTIHVIPVLVDGAIMPDRYDLPEGLQGLARRNAVRLDHETFRTDVAILLDAVDRILPTLAQKAAEQAVSTNAHAADQRDVVGARAAYQRANSWSHEFRTALAGRAGTDGRGGIFINYRRSDERAWFVRALRDRLVDHFGEGQVFLDELSIEVGEDYRREQRKRLVDSQVVIAIIHQEWVAELRINGRDWIREELELALKHQKKIIPLLLGGVSAPMAPALPPSVHEVAYQQAHKIRDESWKHDIEALVQKLEKILAPQWEPGEPESVAPTPPRGWVGYLAAGLTLAAVVAPAWFLPDGASVRGVAVDLSLWLLALMLAPLGANFVTFLSKKPLYFADQSLQDMPLGKYYARVSAPLGVLLVLLTVSAIVYAPVTSDVIPILIGIVIIVTVYLVVMIRNQFRAEEKREKEWPQRLSEPVRAAPVREELARLERKLRDWPSYRPTRELCNRAEWQLRHLRAAGAALSEDAKRGRWRWVMADHPWAFGSYAVWVAGSVGLMTAGSLSTFVVWLPVIVAVFACGVAAATAEFAYRRERWQRTGIADEVNDHTGRIEIWLADLRGRRG